MCCLYCERCDDFRDDHETRTDGVMVRCAPCGHVLGEYSEPETEEEDFDL